eukprot:SAG11_NODE_6231_length_1358_cov_1.144559_1_plen_177_part_00
MRAAGWRRLGDFNYHIDQAQVRARRDALEAHATVTSDLPYTRMAVGAQVDPAATLAAIADPDGDPWSRLGQFDELRTSANPTPPRPPYRLPCILSPPLPSFCPCVASCIVFLLSSSSFSRHVPPLLPSFSPAFLLSCLPPLLPSSSPVLAVLLPFPLSVPALSDRAAPSPARRPRD